MQPLSDGAKLQLEPTVFMGPSTAFDRVVTKAALDIDNQTQALTLRMATLFPCEGPMEDYRIPAETTWTTLVLVEAMGRFRAHHTGALTDQIHRFAELHAATQWKIVERAYSTVVDERTELTETGLAERRRAVVKMNKVLSYVVGLVNFYEQRAASPNHRRAASSKLIQEVFANRLQELRDHWLSPSTGSLVVHLAGMRALDVSQIPFGSAVKKTLLAELLRPLDDLLQPRDRALRAGWVGYAKVSAVMSAAMASLITAVTSNISEGKYAELRSFLESCNRSDIAQACWLNGVSKALAAHVHGKVAAAIAMAQIIEPARPALESDVGAVTEGYTALSTLRDTLHTYLDPPLREVLDQGIMGVRRTATAEACRQFGLATTAASQGCFAECEAALQLVECLLVGTYGSVHAYNEATLFNGPAAADCIEPSAVRAKIEAYVSAVRELYADAFLRVLYGLMAEPTQSNEGAVARSQPGGGADTLSRDAEGTDGYLVVSLPSPEKLRATLLHKPPQVIVSSLLSAAAVARRYSATGLAQEVATFYTSQAEALIQFLTNKIVGVVSLPDTAVRAPHFAVDLLVELTRSASCLPEAVWAEVAPAVSRQLVRLVAEQCERLSLAELIDRVASSEEAAEVQRLVCSAVAGRIQAALLEMGADLDAKKTVVILTGLVAVWPDWSRYFRYIPSEFELSASVEVPRFHVAEVAHRLGKRIEAAFSATAALRPEAPGVFCELEQCVDLTVQLYDAFLAAATAPKEAGELLRLLCPAASDPVSWLSGILSSFFAKASLLLAYHPSRISAALEADTLDFNAVKTLLTDFAQSRSIHARLVNFATSDVRVSVPAVDALCATCRSFESVAEDVVKVLDQQACKLQVDLVAAADIAGHEGDTRGTFYKKLAALYVNLLQMMHLLPHASNVAALVDSCAHHLAAQIAAVRERVLDVVRCLKDSVPREYHEPYNTLYDHLYQFSVVSFGHPKLTLEATEAMAAAHSGLIHVVMGMVHAAADEHDEIALARKLVNIKGIAEGIKSAKLYIDDLLSELLKALKGRDKHCIVRVAMLLDYLKEPTDPTVQEHARMLLKDFSIFEGYQLSLFNSKAARVTFEDVLRNTKAEQLRCSASDASQQRSEAVGEKINAQSMARQFMLFNEEYRALITNGLLGLEAAKERCKVAVQYTKQRPGVPFVDRVRGLMVHLFAYWTLCNSTHYFDNVGQAAGKAADDSSWMYLKQPHAGQIISIFRMFGIDCSVGSEQELQNHFVQIGTGEGKSVVLAITSCIFALLGKHVHCACYSAYLYKRDQAEFRELYEAFDVSNFIKYGTFQDLCESYLNRRGDIRDSVQTIVECPTGQAWTRGGAKVSDFPADGVPKVLLIDEVDVFFKGDFYGCAYRPTAALRDETVSALLDYVWSCRDGFVPVPGRGNNWGSHHMTLAKFKGSSLCGDCVPEDPLCPSCAARYRGSPQYHACVARYPDWVHIIDEAIKQMLRDLKTFKTPTYKYEVVGDRIGYLIQDRIDFKLVEGYKTLFAYYLAAEEGKISSESLEQQKCIRIDCGAYSYAAIPKIYDHLLGVSGTVDCLQSAEKDILCSVYKVQRFTYTASVYSDATSKLRFDETADVKIVSADEHPVAIAEQIRTRRVVPSDPTLFLPVLVFFKTSGQVEEYRRYLARSDALEGCTVSTLTEKNTADKEDLIRQAVRAGTVTLLSRVVGRGTDFYVFSDRVNTVGGVVVIQTFLSEDMSEEVQIKGRTARQGNNGSYCMVLSEQDLLQDFRVDATCVADMRDVGQYVRTLSAKRAGRHHDHYVQLEGDIAVLEKEYGSSMQFVDSLAKVPNDASENGSLPESATESILDFLQHRNSCSPAPILLSRTLVLLDATASMMSLLRMVKDEAMGVFADTQMVLQKAGVYDRRFELQFAAYRNYSSGKEGLLQRSSWTSDSGALSSFMETVDAREGEGREAIEIGLWHANREVADRREGERYQVILIGDAPPNTREEVIRSRCRISAVADNPNYWDDAPYAHVQHYEEELQQLVLEEVPVHAFYVGVRRPAMHAFIDIAARSNGSSAPLDIGSEAGSATIRRLITERILDDVVGGGPEGRRLREIYGRLQQGLQATG
jgi:hypothetical protein